MNLVELLVLLVIAGVCGAVGQSLAGVHRGGCLVAVVLGFLGALIGAWMARSLSLPEPFLVDVGGTPFPILWAIAGSALFVAVLGLVGRGARAPQD